MLSLSDAIIQQDIPLIKRYLSVIPDINELDEYGFTYLIEAVIVNNIEISNILCKAGAKVNQQDVNGNTALHWAVENNNIKLCKLLLQYHANPNAYNISGQPVLVMPILRNQKELQHLLHQAGAEQDFARDFINAKLLGHIFNLVGTTNIVSPSHEFVEVDFEGFYLEITLNLINHSLTTFKNNYGGRKMKHFAAVTQQIINTIGNGATLAKYRQYQVNLSQHLDSIAPILQQEPILLPIGYEGHAISFIKYGEIFALCDRRTTEEKSSTVIIFKMRKPQACNLEFMLNLLYNKHDYEFINHTIPKILQLSPIAELPIEAQTSGNCSWANVEACIPTLLFLLLHQASAKQLNVQENKAAALSFFEYWRNWHKKRSIAFCLQSFFTANELRKATKAELLAAILFQEFNSSAIPDNEITDKILPVLYNSPYKYILDNYLQIYYYQGATEEGKNFAHMLKNYNLDSNLA